MSGEVQGKHEAAPVNWSQPPTASDGADEYIRKLLAPVSGENEGCDFYHRQAGTCEGHKTESRLNQFLKWSGIAFGVAIGGTILKKAITDFTKSKKEKEAAAKVEKEQLAAAAKLKTEAGAKLKNEALEVTAKVVNHLPK